MKDKKNWIDLHNPWDPVVLLILFFYDIVMHLYSALFKINFYFDVISGLQKSSKKDTKHFNTVHPHSPNVNILPSFYPFLSLCINTHYFSQLFESKLKTQ